VLAWIRQVPPRLSVEWRSSVCGGVPLIWRPTGISSWSPPFVLYTVDVLHIIASCGLIAHCYADDTQLYISVPVSAASEAAAGLAKCVERLDLWMAQNRLKLNADKTS